jgi:ABC-type anion transport system duplicated permease subunit
MKPDEQIRMLEETKNEIIRFTNELDDKLARKELNQAECQVRLHEKLGGKTKEELISYIDRKMLAEKNRIKEETRDQKNKKIITFSTATIILILMAIIGIIYTNPGALTGQVTATRQAQEIINYNRVFDHYTETQLAKHRQNHISLL